MTKFFHVDDCNLTHCKRKANYCIIKWLRQDCESIFEDGSGNISVSRGKVHESLLMTLYYTISCQVLINMFSYIEDVLTYFYKADPKGKDKKSSAAPNNIFVVNNY